MTLTFVLLCIAGLVVLLSVGELNAFAAFLLTAFAAGVLLGPPLTQTPKLIEKGNGDTLGAGAHAEPGAVVGQPRAESGATQVLAVALMRAFSTRYIQWAMVVTGFAVGISLYYGVEFLLLLLLLRTHTNPNLMVLASGAGSLLFLHVNDAGFWMFKEHVNLSVKATRCSWSIMEVLVGLMRIVSFLLLNQLLT